MIDVFLHEKKTQTDRETQFVHRRAKMQITVDLQCETTLLDCFSIYNSSKQ